MHIYGLVRKFTAVRISHDTASPLFSHPHLTVNVLTELTAYVVISFLNGCSDVTATIQAPQPPSWHIAFVPLKLAWSLMNVLSDVYTGTSLSTETERKYRKLMKRHTDATHWQTPVTEPNGMRNARWLKDYTQIRKERYRCNSIRVEKMKWIMNEFHDSATF